MTKLKLIIYKVVLFLPAMVIVGWSLLPIIWIGIMSISAPGNLPDTLRLPEVISLDSYYNVLTKSTKGVISGRSAAIWPYMINTIIVAVTVTALTLAISIPATYGISRCKMRGVGFLFFLFLFFRMVPWIALAIPIYLIMVFLGLLDTYFALIFTYIPWNICLAVWLLKGFFDSFPTELEEAALIDGASNTRILTHIVVPIVGPGIAVTAVFVFLSCSIEYIFAVTLTTMSAVTLPVKIAGYVGSHAVVGWQQIGAASLIASIPIIGIYCMAQKYLVRGLTLGAVKG